MNTGIVAGRYATALLKFTREHGSAQRVCAQAKALLKDPGNPPAELEPDLRDFCAFLLKKGRMEDVRLILSIFVRLYHESVGEREALLTLAVRNPRLEEKLKAYLERQTGSKILLETVCDPSILGGFILETDGLMLDGSVRKRLERVRSELVVDNNRIV